MANTGDFFRALVAREGRGRGRGGGNRLQRAIRALPLFAASAAIAMVLFGIGVWWRSAVFSLMSENGVSDLQSMSVLLKPDPEKPGKPIEPVKIGWKEIGQEPGAASAEAGHLELAFDPKTGAVTARNIARTKKLWLSFKGAGDWLSLFGYRFLESSFETFAERIPIPRGATSRLYVLGGSATFRNVTGTSFDLDIAGGPGTPARVLHYDSARGSNALEFTDDHTWNADCAPPSRLSRVRRMVANLVDAVRGRAYALLGRTWVPGTEVDIAVLGGTHDCIEDGRKQIGNIGGLQWRELKIVQRGEWFMLAPYDAADRHKLPVALGPVPEGAPSDRKSYSKVTWRIDAGGPWGEINAIIMGRTEYNVVLCRQGDENNKNDERRRIYCKGASVPEKAVRVVLLPRSKIPVFRAAECQQDDRRDTCPSPLDVGKVEGCDDQGVKCWQWSAPRNALSEAAAASAVTRLTSWERGLRIGVALLVVAVVFSLALGTRDRLARRRGAALTARSSKTPIRWVLLSASLTLAPEIANVMANYLHTPPLDARAAFTIMLCNWGLVAVVLLAGVSGLALGLMWVAVMLLAAIGSVTLAAMAIDGNTTAWTQYFVRQKYLFLDLVPPMILVVASVPPRVLRPVLQELVIAVRPRYRFIVWLPSIALLCAFGLWLVMGGQTGLGPFQPVEAGKFAAVLLAAAALLRLDPDVQRAAVSSNLPARVTSFVVLALFFGVLIAVPAIRSDWSPALIMALLLGGLLATFIFPLCWRVVFGAWRRRVARHRVPLAFRPKPKRRLFGPVMLSLVIPLFIVGGVVMVAPISKFAASWMLSLNEWSDDVNQRLQSLEADSLTGGRRVVAERIIAWVDLMFSKPPRPDCQLDTDPARANKPETAVVTPRACYRDLEWQVIRARRVIAHADCGIKAPLDPASDPTPRRIATAWRAVMAPAATLASLFSARPICGAPLAEPTAAQSELDIVEPIRIPVVESDFAGAYLIGRFGVGAAVLFFAAQMLLLAVILYTFVCVGGARSGNRMDAGLRRFIGVVVAGSGLLFLLQWIFSWSNILGLLPVMGQPMTLLSYAVSHHLFMALPCLMVVVVGLRHVSYDRAMMVPRGVPRRSRWRLFG